ncbi:MAG: O-acetyl-ADP-ribose deacetylase [Gammaproteobacteria bacterium]|nr:O-acetyl-ADP-ribose deacetylase [Gammaproteobacteria bacterium]
MSGLHIIQADITTLDVDVIVNAANNSLLGGGGVDGAIHRAAGPALLEECKTLNGCDTGQAKITAAYKLAAKQIIHTVGPIWQGGTHNEASLLANCYRNSLQLASNNALKSIAFPAISCGVYGFPPDQAAKIAVHEITDFMMTHERPKEIYLVSFSNKMTQILNQAIED